MKSLFTYEDFVKENKKVEENIQEENKSTVEPENNEENKDKNTEESN